MIEREIEIHGHRVPRLLYGTAWKEEATERLTLQALEQGFRGIDTANQRRHYVEADVGRAVAIALARNLVRREELFLQSKFTFRGGQDHRLPYDPQAPIATQVEQSFASSLEHLQVTTLDAYLLHGPSVRVGLAAADREAWEAMQSLYDRGVVSLLGISNVTLPQLQELCSVARIRPHLVQNRCYADRGWDADVRQWCRKEGIGYQGFSLLTANRAALAHPAVVTAAQRHFRTVAQIVFRFALEVGMICLTGTTDVQHMCDDLEVFDFQLSPDEVKAIEGVAEGSA